MKSWLLFVFMMFAPVALQAADDPVLFTVGDMPVTRSEFEQSYLKNTTANIVSRLTIADYLELYIVYKLKVKAALDAHLDAKDTFKKEYIQCQDDQLVLPIISSAKHNIPSSVVYSEYEKQQRNAGYDGLICLAQIFIPLSQKVSGNEQWQARQRIESIYQELQQGADFAQLARQCSLDEMSAQKGGTMGWYTRGQLLEEIENEAFALEKGAMSRPFLSTIGYHILLMTDRKPLEDYAVLEELLSTEIGHRQVHQQVDIHRLEGDVVKRQVALVTEIPQMPIDDLQKEYYEGLLVHELNKQSAGSHAAEDEETLKYYFKKNKKKYRQKGFKPKDYTEVREFVVADLRQEMDKHWLADLRNRYPVKVDKQVLKTVNNHL